MLRMSQGGLDKSPFPEKHIQQITTNLQDVLKEYSFDEGPPRSDDAEQLTRVRLVQSLL